VRFRAVHYDGHSLWLVPLNADRIVKVTGTTASMTQAASASAAATD
jgi:hypothetical protein